MMTSRANPLDRSWNSPEALPESPWSDLRGKPLDPPRATGQVQNNQNK